MAHVIKQKHSYSVLFQRDSEHAAKIGHLLYLPDLDFHTYSTSLFFWNFSLIFHCVWNSAQVDAFCKKWWLKS